MIGIGTAVSLYYETPNRFLRLFHLSQQCSCTAKHPSQQIMTVSIVEAFGGIGYGIFVALATYY